MRDFKHYFVLILMSLGYLTSYAHDFEVNGIYYNITSMSNFEVEVTYRGELDYYSNNPTPYTGDIFIPQKVTFNNKDFTVTGIGKNAFGGTAYHSSSGTAITSIWMPNTVRYISEGGFRRCRYLEHIKLSTSLQEIQQHAFYETMSLENITIPENVTVISWMAFEQSGIKYAILGKNVVTLGDGAFKDCKNLVEIYNLGRDIQRTDVFTNCPKALKIYNVRSSLFFEKSTFIYTGKAPTTDWYNTIDHLSCSMDMPELSKEAGQHEVTCMANYSNFSGTIKFTCEIPYSYTVKKAPLTISAQHRARTYGDENPALDATISGFVNNEDENVLSKYELYTTATPSSDAGTYPIQISAEAKNYNITAISGILTINKAPLTVTVVPSEKVYGDKNPTFSVTYSGQKIYDINPYPTQDVSFTTDANILSEVGTYIVTANKLEFKNYEITKYVAGTLTVKKAPLTITCNNATKAYGDVNPAFSFTYTGLKNNDTEDNAFTLKPTVDTDITRRTNVGVYDIIGSNGASKNYKLEYNKGTLTIIKAPLCITANDATREYGEVNPAFTFKYEGFKNEETESVLTDAPIATSVGRTADAGEYNIVSEGATASNYDISYHNGKLTITKAPLEVRVNNASRLYGESNPMFTFQYTGLKNDDDASCITTQPTVVTDATEESPVGTYTLSALNGSARNYEFKKYTNGILTIGRAELKVTANNLHMTYGEALPTLTYTCSGLRNNDTSVSAFSEVPSLNCAATATSKCGEYPILISGGTSNNYQISYVDGIMVIDKRELVAMVGNYARPYNEENPQFEIKYSGFVNNDNDSHITTKPTVSCKATKTSDTGDYEIGLYGGNAENYSFVFVNGKLTIEKAEQEIVWEQKYENVSVGDQLELTAQATSGLDIEYSVSDESIASLYKVGKNRIFLDCIKGGTVIVRVKQSGNNNYYSSATISKTIIVRDETGIENVTKDAFEDPTIMRFNLNGQHVTNIAKGIIIVNGKKYLRK